MSRTTRPDTEGSITCGFFNRLPSDAATQRKYDAEQMGAIFDGLIKDGIFASIGSGFVVKASTGNTVTIGTGKAWLNHTWTNNDAILPIECDASEVLLDRIDAIVIEVNTTEDVRDNRIQIIKGDPSSSPVRPTLTNTKNVHQHALCYITRPAGSSAITQSNIRNVIGTETPYVTGIVDVLSLETILGQWEDELDQFTAAQESDFSTWKTNKESEYTTWYNGMVDLMAAAVTEINDWTESQQATIMDWFNDLKGTLSDEDVATNLQVQISNSEIERILMVGLTNGVKTISTDGKVITTTDSLTGQILTKTFSDDFSTCTIVLKDKYDSEIGRLVKTFSSNGQTITSVLTGVDPTVIGTAAVVTDLNTPI